jgi:DNA-binding IclR family transcriptional regulator
LELISLGVAVHVDLRRELRPILEALSLEIDETVDLSVLDKDQIVFLDQVQRLRHLQAVSGVGIKFPLHCTAPGKAFLASLAEEEVERILPEQLHCFTPQTIPTRERLLQELELVRVEGVAYDREEYTRGICAVGALICGPLNSQAAISTPVPSVRFYGEEQRLRTALLQTCDLIDQRYKRK